KAGQDILMTVLACEHNDRHKIVALGRAQDTAYLKTADIGHNNVQQYEIRFLLADHAQSILPARRPYDVVTFLRQRFDDYIRKKAAVINDQDFFPEQAAHRPSP